MALCGWCQIWEAAPWGLTLAVPGATFQWSPDSLTHIPSRNPAMNSQWPFRGWESFKVHG